MGFESEDYILHVSASLSHHNSENDVIDAELWQEIEEFINTKAAEIETFIKQSKFKRIGPFFC